MSDDWPANIYFLIIISSSVVQKAHATLVVVGGGFFMEDTCVMRWSSTPEVLLTYKEIPDCFSSHLCSEPLAHSDLELHKKYPSLCSKDECWLTGQSSLSD